MVQPTKRKKEGGKIMIVKDTLNFPKMKFVKVFKNYSEKTFGWIPIAVQDRGMGFPTYFVCEYRRSQGMLLKFGLLDIVIVKCSSDTQF